MPANPISLADIWKKTECAKCGAIIRKGEPRCVLMFVELGIGPGHREFRDQYDDDRGLITSSSSAKAMCRPCGSEPKTLELENPWFKLREQLAADDPGGSVFATPVSQLNISSAEVDDDYVGGRDAKGNTAAARNDAIDSFFNARAEAPLLQTSLRANDYRVWMKKFLVGADSRVISGDMRKVCELWAAGKKQAEISAESGISQATVSRMIRDGRDLLYSQHSKAS
jgi:hypothetical protein